MTRNMEKRVEISFPILDIEMKARIKAILQLTLADNVKTREQNKDGDYYYVINNGAEEIDSQVKLFKMAYQNTDAEYENKVKPLLKRGFTLFSTYCMFSK